MINPLPAFDGPGFNNDDVTEPRLGLQAVVPVFNPSPVFDVSVFNASATPNDGGPDSKNDDGPESEVVVEVEVEVVVEVVVEVAVVAESVVDVVAESEVAARKTIVS